MVDLPWVRKVESVYSGREIEHGSMKVVLLVACDSAPFPPMSTSHSQGGERTIRERSRYVI
jgi:hypothetical protein